MIYLSPHNQQMAAYQREVDRIDERETERERLSNNFFKELNRRAEFLKKILPSFIEYKLENLLLGAADLLADQEITNLEQGKHNDF